MLKPSSGQRPVLVFVGTAALAAVTLFGLFAPLSGAWHDIPLLLIVLGALVSGTLGVVAHRRAQREPHRLPTPPSKAQLILSLFNKLLITFLATASVQTMIAGTGGLIVRGALLLAVAGLLWLLERVQQRIQTASASPEAAPQLHVRRRWVQAAALSLFALQLGGLSINIAYSRSPCGWLDLPRRLRGCQGALRSPSSVTALSYARDGSLLAITSMDGQIHLWSLPDQRMLPALQGQTSRAIGVAIAPDSQTVAAASWDGTLQLWRVSDGALIQTLPADSDYSSGVAFSPDGSILATSRYGTELKLWRVADGSLINTISDVNIGNRLAFTPDGTTLLASGTVSSVQGWDIASGALRRNIAGGDIFDAFALSPDGTLVAAGDDEGQLTLWRMSDGRLVRHWQAQSDSLTELVFSPDGSVLASAGNYNDETVRVWRVADGALLRTIKLTRSARGLAFAPDSRTLAIAARDDVLLWRYR